MVKVVILPILVRQIQKLFKKESDKIYSLMKELALFPQKGKALGHIHHIVIKEIKFKNFRFYFITDGHVLKCCHNEELKNLLIKFVRMSDKKDQKKVIQEIKYILKKAGFDDFR